MGMRPPVPESPRPGSGGAKPPFLEGRSGTGTRPPPGRRTERQNSNSESIDGIPGIHTNLSKCEVSKCCFVSVWVCQETDIIDYIMLIGNEYLFFLILQIPSSSL